MVPSLIRRTLRVPLSAEHRVPALLWAVLLFMILCLGWVTGGHAALPPPAELPDLVEKVLPSVVNISSTKIQRMTVYGMDEFFRLWGVPQSQPQTSLGSGFILGKDGFVLTNNHVIEGADEVMVTLYNQKSYKTKLIGRDEKLDLALLRIRDPSGGVPGDLAPTTWGDSTKVRIAETIFAVGNPFGLRHTVTAGIISAKNRTIGIGPLDNFLQTDASINPGNSGGPLFNLKGEVIGVNTVIFSRTGQNAGLGFAIPANEAKAVLDDLKKYGRVPRPWLGIVGQAVTPGLAAHYDLPANQGVIVANLVEGGPAQDGGIRVGDIIVEVNGVDVKGNSDVERELYKKKPGDAVSAKVRRRGKSLDVKLKLAELPRLDRLPQGII
jgi:serine protease Do